MQTTILKTLEPTATDLEIIEKLEEIESSRVDAKNISEKALKL